MTRRTDGPVFKLDGIRAILFDLDGTLRHSRPAYNQALFRLLDAYGAAESETRRQDAMRWAHYYFASSPEIADDLEAAGADRDLLMAHYVRRFLIAYGWDPTRAADCAPEIQAELRASLQQHDCVDPQAPETLRKLRAAGYVLGVVSNRYEPLGGVLDTLELGHYFDFSLAAGEVDSWKPDGEIFHTAVELAGSCPDCTLYVGDNYYADAIGAQRAGLQAVLLDPDDLFPDADCPVIHSLDELTRGLG
jgi:putative hydrolase of the HAD superfamily